MFICTIKNRNEIKLNDANLVSVVNSFSGGGGIKTRKIDVSL